MLGSLVSKLNNQLDESFIQENDYLHKFLLLQKKIFMNLSEEMKYKIIASLQSTSKIISESNKDLLNLCRKEISELEQSYLEREKTVKK